MLPPWNSPTSHPTNFHSRFSGAWSRWPPMSHILEHTRWTWIHRLVLCGTRSKIPRMEHFSRSHIGYCSEVVCRLARWLGWRAGFAEHARISASDSCATRPACTRSGSLPHKLPAMPKHRNPFHRESHRRLTGWVELQWCWNPHWIGHKLDPARREGSANRRSSLFYLESFGLDYGVRLSVFLSLDYINFCCLIFECLDDFGSVCAKKLFLWSKEMDVARNIDICVFFEHTVQLQQQVVLKMDFHRQETTLETHSSISNKNQSINPFQINVILV